MAENDVVIPRFFKLFLSGTTSESMEIPTCFTEYLKDPLPQTAKLQGTGGRTWTVSFTKIRDRAYFTAGWSKFSEDHELKDGEYLTFVYDCERTFEVSVFGRCGFKETRAVAQTVEVSDSDSDEEDTSVANAPVVAGSSNLGDMTSLFFNTHLKKRKYYLLIPSNVVKHHMLTFGETINYIDEEGTMVGERSQYADDRVSFNGWDRICRRNRVKVKDQIKCEVLRNMNLVHSIKIHITRA